MTIRRRTNKFSIINRNSGLKICCCLLTITNISQQKKRKSVPSTIQLAILVNLIAVEENLMMPEILRRQFSRRMSYNLYI